MSEHKLREKRILAKLNLDRLPYELEKGSFKTLGARISNFIHQVFLMQQNTKSINWCFANIKKAKIFFLIFHANENNKQIYKEEISKKLPEYSYKTISKIVDEGIEKGHFTLLSIDGENGKDRKIKNIRPSEELVSDFLNLGIEIISYISKGQPK